MRNDGNGNIDWDAIYASYNDDPEGYIEHDEL